MSNTKNTATDTTNTATDAPVATATATTTAPLSASKQKQLQKQSERSEFMSKLRKTRTLRVLLRDESKEDLEDYLLNFSTVIEEILEEKREAEDKLEADRESAKQIVAEMKEKGLNLDMIRELINQQ